MISQNILDRPDIEFFKHHDLSRFMTIKLEFIGNLVICKSLEALKLLQRDLDLNKREYRMIGWGANQVLTNKKLIYIKYEVETEPEELKSLKSSYIFSATTSLSKLTAMALKFGLKGWESITGIPGTVGGAICMNAGTSLGEIGDYIEKVWILSSKGQIKEVKTHKKDFSYRKNNFLNPGDIIFQAQIRHDGVDDKVKKIIKDYMKYRKKTQPLATKNCGSVFKNPSSDIRAGKLIDDLGLKGMGSENLHISKLHGNFIEHHGGANTQDFVVLINKIQTEVEQKSGIKFELEVKVD